MYGHHNGPAQSAVGLSAAAEAGQRVMARLGNASSTWAKFMDWTENMQRQLAQCNSEVGTPGSKEFVKHMSERPLLLSTPQDCSVATWKKIRCRIVSLEMQLLEFMIKGNISFQWVSWTQQQKVSLVSEARIEYEEKKYTQEEGFIQHQVQTVMECFMVYNCQPIILGRIARGLFLLARILVALSKGRGTGLGILPHAHRCGFVPQKVGPGDLDSATQKDHRLGLTVKALGQVYCQ
ncbi:unnamed protein product [Caretta caretta]